MQFFRVYITIGLVILNTKIVVYKRQQDGSIMKVIDVLRLSYKEMKADEYDSKVCSQKWLRTKMANMRKYIMHFICKIYNLNNT